MWGKGLFNGRRYPCCTEIFLGIWEIFWTKYEQPEWPTTAWPQRVSGIFRRTDSQVDARWLTDFALLTSAACCDSALCQPCDTSVVTQNLFFFLVFVSFITSNQSLGTWDKLHLVCTTCWHWSTKPEEHVDSLASLAMKEQLRAKVKVKDGSQREKSDFAGDTKLM